MAGVQVQQAVRHILRNLHWPGPKRGSKKPFENKLLRGHQAPFLLCGAIIMVLYKPVSAPACPEVVLESSKKRLLLSRPPSLCCCTRSGSCSKHRQDTTAAQAHHGQAETPRLRSVWNRLPPSHSSVMTATCMPDGIVPRVHMLWQPRCCSQSCGNTQQQGTQLCVRLAVLTAHMAQCCKDQAAVCARLCCANS